MSGPRTVRCVHEESVSGLLDDALAPAERDRVAAHVDGCDRCAHVLEELRAADAALRSGLADLDGWGGTDRGAFTASLLDRLDAAASPGEPAAGATATPPPAIARPVRPERDGAGPISLGAAGAVLAAGIVAGFLVGGIVEVRFRDPARGGPAAELARGPLLTSGTTDPAITPIGGGGGLGPPPLDASVSRPGGSIGSTNEIGGGLAELPSAWRAPAAEERAHLASTEALLDAIATIGERDDPAAWERLRTEVIAAGILSEIQDERTRAVDPELRRSLARIELLLLRMINANQSEANEPQDAMRHLSGALREAGLREQVRSVRRRNAR